MHPPGFSLFWTELQSRGALERENTTRTKASNLDSMLTQSYLTVLNIFLLMMFIVANCKLILSHTLLSRN